MFVMWSSKKNLLEGKKVCDMNHNSFSLKKFRSLSLFYLKIHTWKV